MNHTDAAEGSSLLKRALRAAVDEAEIEAALTARSRRLDLMMALPSTSARDIAMKMVAASDGGDNDSSPWINMVMGEMRVLAGWPAPVSEDVA